jgi:hypothetical protein
MGPKLPPHDFFLKASQKRARREADAAAARETARLAAVDQQRQHVEVRASSILVAFCASCDIRRDAVLSAVHLIRVCIHFSGVHLMKVLHTF